MDGPEPGDPTQDEIEQRAAEVRSRWTVKQEILRWTGPRAGWSPPIFAATLFPEENDPDTLGAY